MKKYPHLLHYSQYIDRHIQDTTMPLGENTHSEHHVSDCVVANQLCALQILTMNQKRIFRPFCMLVRLYQRFIY